MKQIVAALALSTALAAGAFAQGTGGSSGSAGGAGGPNDASSNAATGAIAPRGASVTMDEQTRIRTYWRSARPAGVTMSGSIAMGSSVPADVELRAFPSNVGVTNYRYVVVGDNMYLVDPGTRRVVYMME